MSDKPSLDGFHARLRAYTDFRAQHHRDPRRRSSDPAERSLALWLMNIRGGMIVLDQERVDALDEINPDWRGSVNRRFDTYIEECRQFARRHGHPPSWTSRDRGEKRLGEWLRRQRNLGPALSEQQRVAVAELHPPRQSVNETPLRRRQHFTRRATQTRQFVTAHGRLPRVNATDQHERMLALWLGRQRGRIDTLDPDDKQMLDDCVPGWHVGLKTFAERVSEYAAFRAEHGRNPLQSAADPVESSLGRWLRNQRRKANEGVLSDAQAAQLAAVNPLWRHPKLETSRRIFADRIEAYLTYRARHGRDPNSASPDPGERSLYCWITVMRARDSRGDLPDYQREALDAAHPGWRRHEGHGTHALAA